MEPEQKAVVELQEALHNASNLDNHEKAVNTIKSLRYLYSIPLDSIPADVLVPTTITRSQSKSVDEKSNAGDLELAEAEALTKRITLNSVTFYGTSLLNDSGSISNSIKSPFLSSLLELCNTLCATITNDDKEKTVDPTALYESIITRMSQKISRADSYFKLNSMMGSPELMLMPLKNAAINGTETCPTEIELFVEGGNIHANISSTEYYGLFRKGDVKGFHPSADNTPWVIIDASTCERVNFTNGQSVRCLKAKVV